MIPKTTPKKTAPGPGRPFTMAGGRRINLYLDAGSIATAARLGGGNISAGVRAALASADKSRKNPAKPG